MKLKKCSECGNSIKDKKVIECPYCSSTDWNKPKIEKELSALQTNYFEIRKKRISLEAINSMGKNTNMARAEEDKYLAKIVTILQDTAQNIIFGRLSRSGAFNHFADIQEMASDSAYTILGYYKTNPEFRIDSSFVGYLLQVIKFPMYNSKKQDREEKEISINTPISQKDGQKERTLEDKLSDTAHDSYYLTEDYFIQNADKEYLIRDIRTLITSIFNKAVEQKGIYLGIRFIILLNFFLDKKPESYFNKVWDRYPTEEKDLFDQFLMLISDFLKSRTHLVPENYFDKEE